MLSPFVLGQPPFMQFTDLNAVFMPFGKMYTFDWFTRESKVTYSDPDGMTESDNPIIMDGIGRLPMTWFATDSPYYLEITDRFDNLIFQTPEPYIPGIGSGTILDEALDSTNLFINGQFYSYPIASYSPVPHVIDYLADGGWGWEQDGTNTSDTLQFVNFPLDNNAISPPAVSYLSYVSTLAGTSETYKNLYYLIPNVRSLANEQITLSFQAESAIAGNFQLTVIAVQNFGTGGSPSPDVTTILGAVTLTSAYQELNVTGNIPDLSGKTLGTNGDDYLKIIILYPLNTAQGINITNLFFKRGVSVVGYPYLTPLETQAQVFGYNGQWSTGDRKETYKAVADPGWIMMDNGTIGTPTSIASNRANVDTFALYTLLWNNVSSPSSNVYCSVNSLYATGTASQSAFTVTGIGTTFTSAMVGGTITFSGGATATITVFNSATSLTVGTSQSVSATTYQIVYGTIGANASADFLANKVLQLPLTLGRLSGAAGNNGTNTYVLGQNAGAATTSVTLVSNQLPNPITAGADTMDFTVGGVTPVIISGASAGSGIVGNPGGGQPIVFANVPLSSYCNLMIKL